MHLLDLTLDTPAENLALDEALLESAELGAGPGRVLRLWEPATPAVVVGRSSRVDEEVDLEACRLRDVPVLRRASGGAAVVIGPGCLMYSVVLAYRDDPSLRMISQAHRHALGVVAGAVRSLLPGVELAGTSDLALAGRKFSGNSLRCKREHLLYHGTLLYDFPLELIAACLKQPPRQPEYRAGRGHEAFIANLPLRGAALRCALIAAWEASPSTDAWPEALTRGLVVDRYARAEWTFQR
jgi:lipoate-protein ligase A